MSRAQEIIAYIVGKRRRVGLDELVRNIEPVSDNRANTVKRFAAQLYQLTAAGKLARHGKPRAYTYSTTPRSLVDGRRVDADGKPRNKTAQRRTAAPKPRAVAAPKPKPAAKPAAPRKAKDNQRFVIARPASTTRPPGQPETVAEFLKRGGRIQKLKPGESSSPLYESVRALNDRSMRKRLRDADNDPTPDTFDDDASDIVAAIA